MGWLKSRLNELFDSDRPALVRESEIHPDPRYDSDDASLKAVLGGDGDVNRHRAARACRELVRRNPMARRILRLNEDYVVGYSLQVRLDLEDEKRQEEIQKELDRWRRVARVHTAFWQRLWRQYLTDGELAIRMVPMGRTFRPVAIDTTQMVSGKDNGTGEVVALRAQVDGREVTYKVRNTLAQYDGEDAAEEVLFFSHDGERGVPELLPVLSRLVWEDEITRLEIARVKALKRWFWHVTMEGATQPELEALNDEFSTAPRTGSVRWTNEKVKWEAVSTQVGSYETAAFLRALRGSIAGGAGHPLHWHGDGGDANLATATAMGTPSHRQMERLQGEFRDIVEEVYTWAVELLGLGGRIGDVELDSLSWDVTLPEVDPRDFETGTKSVLQAVTAVDAAVDSHYLTFGAGQRIVREVVQNVTGVEILESDLGEEPEKDGQPDFHGAPPPPPPPPQDPSARPLAGPQEPPPKAA